jgi:prepilin-type N-terminal cleavage/methylation domain-containing protein
MPSRIQTRSKRGFTLPEVLVTITLIAILAAVVVPTIASQVKKGDPTRVGNDFMAIRGGVEQFLSDVRRYPKSIGQLTSVITTSQNPLAGTSGATYASTEVTRWRGPYINKDSTAAAISGYAFAFKTPFDTVSLGSADTTSAAGGQKYMVLLIPTTDRTAALELDRQFDDGVLTTGVIRFRCAGACGTGTDTLKYLIMPVY